MTRNARIASLVAALLVVVAAVIIVPSLGDDDDVDSPSPPPPTAAATQAVTPTATTDTRRTTPARSPAPDYERIRIRDGKPAGGVSRVRLEKGDKVRLEVTTDADDELHIHGYDRYVDVKQGRRTRVVFDADIEGIFEIESHGTGELLAELEVRPS